MNTKDKAPIAVYAFIIFMVAGLSILAITLERNISFLSIKLIQSCIIIYLLILLKNFFNQHYFLLLSSAVICLSIGYGLGFGVVDDAYISMRYSKNMAQGIGLVFNAGERVEGYTSFLWVLLLACLKFIASDALFIWIVKHIGIVFFFLSCHKMVTISKTAGGDAQSQSILIFLMGANFPIVFWAFSGMETLFYLWLLLSASHHFCRYLLKNGEGSKNIIKTSFYLVLAYMTRPETVLIIVLHVFIILIFEKQNLFRLLQFFCLPFCAIYLPYFAWHYWYYNDFLPNTYYAKVGHPATALSLFGLNYIREGTLSLLAIFIILAAYILRKRIRLPIHHFYFLGIIVMVAFSIILTGADHFGEYRYFVYILPFIFLLIAEEIEDGATWIATKMRPLFSNLPLAKTQIISTLCIFIFLYGFYYNDTGPRTVMFFGRNSAEKWGTLGKLLKKNTKIDSVIVSPVVGALGYYCDRRVIDMVGLTEPAIARNIIDPGKGPKDHERYNSEYIMSQNPDYIYLFHAYKSEKEFLASKSWIPAIQDIKRFFPNDSYEYVYLTYYPYRYALYKKL